MSALALRLLACLLMLCDHLGYFLSSLALRALGRLSFPIFAFLLANGFWHTSCRWKYALRLAIFAVLSQIPFSLCFYGTLWADTWNVFVTLLLGLLTIWAVDMLRSKGGKWPFWLLPFLLLALFAYLDLLKCDYGLRGILLVVVFYWVDAATGFGRWQTACAMLVVFYYPYWGRIGQALVCWLTGGVPCWPQFTAFENLKFFALLALYPIFQYHGGAGYRPARRWQQKLMQYGFYLFYPVHLMLLYAFFGT